MYYDKTLDPIKDVDDFAAQIAELEMQDIVLIGSDSWHPARMKDRTIDPFQFEGTSQMKDFSQTFVGEEMKQTVLVRV